MAEKALAVAALSCALVLSAAVPASAHAELTATSPALGSVVPAAPAEVTLTFDEPVVALTPTAIRVFDDHLRRVDAADTGHLSGRGDAVGVDLQPQLAAGTYTVTYRVVSADSHPVEGGFAFSIRAPSVVRGNATELGGGSKVVGIALGAARFVEYAGLVVGSGGLVFFLLWPAGRRERDARRLVFGGFVTLLAGSVVAFFLEAPYVAGTGLGTIVDGGILSTVASSHFGGALILRVLVVALILLLFRALLARGRYGFPSTVAGIAVVLADSFADAGHSAVHDNYGLAQLSDGAHVLAMTVWLGGLVMLVAVGLRRRAVELRSVLPRFSGVATTCIAVIAGTGAYQAVRNVGYWPALVDTTYGRLVLAKIGGLAVIVALGYFARRFAVRDGADVAGFRRGLVAEIAIAAAVLAVTAVLVATLQGKTAYTGSLPLPATRAVESTSA